MNKYTWQRKPRYKGWAKPTRPPLHTCGPQRTSLPSLCSSNEHVHSHAYMSSELGGVLPLLLGNVVNALFSSLVPAACNRKRARSWQGAFYVYSRPGPTSKQSAAYFALIMRSICSASLHTEPAIVAVSLWSQLGSICHTSCIEHT
jgi:hypothetical protein